MLSQGGIYHCLMISSGSSEKTRASGPFGLKVGANRDHKREVLDVVALGNAQAHREHGRRDRAYGQHLDCVTPTLGRHASLWRMAKTSHCGSGRAIRATTVSAGSTLNRPAAAVGVEFRVNSAISGSWAPNRQLGTEVSKPFRASGTGVVP